MPTLEVVRHPGADAPATAEWVWDDDTDAAPSALFPAVVAADIAADGRRAAVETVAMQVAGAAIVIDADDDAGGAL